MQQDPMHILLADDDEDDRMLFNEAFKDIKIKTVISTVNDGVQLMEYLNNDTNIMPGILFLDLNMPRKNGHECLEEIRNSKKLKHLTVAIYSTSASEADIEDTFVKGANVYIRKPDDFLVLKKILAEVVTINWQYQTSGMNKDNFLLSI